jgi:hypothetical protein
MNGFITSTTMSPVKQTQLTTKRKSEGTNCLSNSMRQPSMTMIESINSFKGIINPFISPFNPKIRPLKLNVELYKTKIKILSFKLTPSSKISIEKKTFRQKFKMTTKNKLKDSKTRLKTTKTLSPISSMISRTQKSRFPDFKRNWKILTIVYRIRPKSIRPA